MTSFTPGPWEVCGNFVRNPMPEGIIIAEAARIPDYQANARLIASAPELLQALQELLKFPSGQYSEYDGFDAACLKAEAAIKKATS